MHHPAAFPIICPLTVLSILRQLLLLVKKCAGMIFLLANTFSTLQEDYYLKQLRSLNKNAYDYVVETPAKTWWSNDWSLHNLRPIQHGIVHGMVL